MVNKILKTLGGTRVKLKKISKFNAFGLVGASALCLLVVAMLCPTVADTTKALDCDSDGTQCVETGDVQYSSTDAPLAIDAAVASVISIGLQSQMEIEVTPVSTTNLNVATNKANLSVKTNNSSGYAVYMTGLDGNTDLVNNADATKKITSMAGSKTNLTENSWGYAVNAAGAGTPSTFSAIPASSSYIIGTNTVDTSKEDNYDLTFGVAINSDLPAGLYSGSVVVSAVANPIKLTSLRQLYYMQDMTGDICANTQMDDTKQLIDTRDGKKYWVAKLRDGNCWMTQNLALDLSKQKTLTPADTNVKTNYTPDSNTDDISFNGTNPGTVSQTTQYSWGKWKNTLLATPLFGRNCNSGRGSDQYNSIISSEELYNVCSGEGFINVAGWQPTYKAQNGKMLLPAGNKIDSADAMYQNGGYEYSGLIAADSNNQTYDAHYLVGNYYQFNAATAGTGGSITNSNATSSICPKGWTLPRSGNQGSIFGTLNADNGTFFNLLNAYGVASKVSSVAGSYQTTLRNTNGITGNTGYKTFAQAVTANNMALVNGNKVPYTVTDGEFNIAADPLYFVRSGRVYRPYGFLRFAGIHGNYWSTSGAAATSAYYLDFNASDVYPSLGPHNRYHGFSLRCLQE